MSAPDRGTNLFNLIATQAGQAPQTTAILAPGQSELSWSGLVEFVSDTTARLASLGLRRGKRAALVLPNGPCAATAFLAVSNLATAAPLNPAYSASEFEYYLSDLKASAVVLEREADSPARAAAAKLGLPIIEIAPLPGSQAGVFELSGDLLDSGSIEVAQEQDVALVLHTSGTTSRPKIVPLTHANLRASAVNIAHSLNLSPQDRCLNIMPLFHVHGLMAAVVGSLTAGGSVICTSGLNPDEVLGWLTKLEPTWLTAVPTMLQSILEKATQDPGHVAQTKLRFLRACSSALPPQVAEKLETVFRVPVLEAYGMTEASHQIAVNPQPPGTHKFGSVGRAFGDEVAILDTKGELLPANTPGEISIRGTNVMGGYEANPAANQSAFSISWLRTGDLGLIDEEGYIFIQGRVKEIINRGGEKIAPREVDEALLQHPAIAQAVAFGMPHPALGEEVAAAVVLRSGMQVSAKELTDFASERLAYFKLPRRIVFLTEIPKGPTGKVQRIGLAEKLKDALTTAAPDARKAPIPPRTPTETLLVGVWAEVLGTLEFGIQDDFLELGGDSLKAVQVLARLNANFNLKFTIKELFNLPTIQALADAVDRAHPK